ncbi:hypothetical protein GBAR_LOCUS13898 [Geodia barretti]|uniref:Uncharacterized protein n=1 Tax=Geodia barretti TaxID=519541 RepID=A0AA35S7S9_GEOBA|nr:hypothetical protein GBAR_LOCUS13898 [Geodia barretti]
MKQKSQTMFCVVAVILRQAYVLHTLELPWQYCYLHYFSRLLHLESFSRGENMCANVQWNGETPNVAKASLPGKLSTSNVAMIVIGLLSFICWSGNLCCSGNTTLPENYKRDCLVFSNIVPCDSYSCSRD